MPTPAATPAHLSMTDLHGRYTVDAVYLSGLVDGLGLETFHGRRGAKVIQESDLPKVEAALRRVGKLPVANGSSR